MHNYYEKICYLKTKLHVINKAIDYDKEDHRLYFLDKIISNLNQYLLYGVSKGMLRLYYSRFNHRKCRSIMVKIKNYLTHSINDSGFYGPICHG